MPGKINIRKILGMGVLCLFLLGCSKDSFLLPDEEQNNLTVKEEVTTNQEKALLGVHICGAVQNPGVYFLEQGQRVCHAIEMAGGLKEEADGDYINQALLLEDGMKITIPTKEEIRQKEMAEEQQESMSYVQTTKDYVEQSSNTDYLSTQSSKDSGFDDKVDLNTADEALLCTLPGIGESRAKSIITFRTKNGPFEKIEDVMKVSGIKEAAFEKIKDLIKVSN